MTAARPTRLWPWILGIAVLAAAVWLVVAIGERRGPPEPADPAAAGAPPEADTPAAAVREPVSGAAAASIVARTEEMRAAVRRYEEGCSAGLEQATGTGLGAVVADCIERLRHALDAVVASDTVISVPLGERLDRYRELGRQLEATPPGEGRAGPTREVMRSAADVLETIRDERYAESLGEDGALADARAAAERLDPDRALSAQQDRVRRFFLAAGALLSAMARPGDPGPGS